MAGGNEIRVRASAGFHRHPGLQPPAAPARRPIASVLVQTGGLRDHHRDDDSTGWRCDMERR